MRFLQNRLIAVILASGGAFVARADNATPVAPATRPVPAARQPTDVAAPKLDKDGRINAQFQEMHNSFLKRDKEGPIGILFLGDSITAGWIRAKDVWTKHYGALDPANFGIPGDGTQHVLWRIDNGELDGIKPKIVVLMIGTNNMDSTAEEILKGDQAVVAKIHEKLPDSKLLLLGIFPRGTNPADPHVAMLRDKIKVVNEGLAKLEDGDKTRYLDIGNKFLNADQELPKEIMPDALHPNHVGYEIWANAMQQLLDKMMQ